MQCKRLWEEIFAKRYRDENEKTHNTAKTGVVYVCELCNQMCNSLDNLKKHKLNHSSAKKHICRICKIRGFTRTNDRLWHEEECGPKFNVRINDDGEVVTLDTPDNPPPQKNHVKKQPKKNCFRILVTNSQFL